MKYQLRATKSRLYRLAKHYWPEIASMRETEYTKYPRVRDYAMHFQAGTYFHRIFLSVYDGKALLADTYSYYDDEGEEIKHGEVHTLTLDELCNFELLEEVQG